MLGRERRVDHVEPVPVFVCFSYVECGMDHHLPPV